MADLPDALKSTLTSKGATFGELGGRQAALHFGDPAGEELALANAAGIAEYSDRTQFALKGDDGAAFLHNLCTNDIRRLSPGQGCEAFLLNAHGKTVAHGHIFRGAEELVFDTVPGQHDFLLKHLNRYLIRERVELVPRPEDGELLLAGPGASAVLAALGVIAPPTEPCAHLEAEIAGSTVSLRRVDLAGEHSCLICTRRDELAAVWRELVRNGARPCGALAAEAVRIATGAPLFGIDITDANLPQEVNRNELAISFTKGCYLGQETVARIDALGHVNRLLVGLSFATHDVPLLGTELNYDGKSVGGVTSAAFSHCLRHTIALAYVRRQQAAPGTVLQSALGNATVVALPMRGRS